MKKLKILSFNLLLFLGAVVFVFPMLWMLLLSIKQYPESFNNIWDLLAAPSTLANYTEAFASDDFGLYFLNSTLIALAVTAANILFCLWAGYAFARRNTKFKKGLFATVLGVLIIPPHVIMIPLYRLMVSFGWINTYYALIAPWIVTPFGIFLLKQYISGLPTELEDAARIDGAGEWRILFKIVMPLAKPALTALALYTFLSNWNSFLFPFLFTNETDVRTLPVGLAFYLGKQSIDWGNLMAGAAISALPILILFVLFQKKIIMGLTQGALKE